MEKMKEKRKFLPQWLSAVLLCGAVLALAGCKEAATELSSNASVASVTVAGKTVTLGTPSMDWMVAKESGNVGSVYLTTDAMVNAEVVVNKGDDGQSVYLAQALPAVMPDFVNTTTTFTFDPGDYLWVEVFSENHDDYKIYAIQVQTSTPTVLDVTLAGRSAEGGVLPDGRPIQQYGTGLGTPHTDLAQAVEGEIWYGDNQEGTALVLAATAEDPDSVLSIATGAGTATVSSLTFAALTGTDTVTVTNGNYLYIKSVSSDAVNGDTIYYKVKLVSKEVDLTIAGVTIQGNTNTPVSFTVGAAGTQGFGGGENRANAANLAANNAGYKNIFNTPITTVTATVTIGTTPAGATIRYGHTDWDAAQEGVESTGHTTLTYQTGNVLTGIPNHEFIAVEVTNELGDKNWYAFRISIGYPDSALTALTISGNTVSSLPAANIAATGTISVDFTMSASGPWTGGANASVSTGATTDYGIAAAAAAAPAAFTPTLGSVTSGQFVVVRVTPGDGGPPSYYKVRPVFGSTNADLATVTIGGTTASIGTAGVFSVGAIYSVDWKGNITEAAAPSFTTGTAGAVTVGASGPYAVTAAATDTNATVRYGWLVDTAAVGFTPAARTISWSTTADIPSFAAMPTDGTDAVGINGWVVIEVTSENGVVVQTYAIQATGW